jgi:hypothetical protein
MIDAQGEAPVLHRFGNKLAIVSDENFEGETSLHSHMLVPQAEHRSRIPFASEREAPNITGKVVDYVHGIQAS